MLFYVTLFCICLQTCRRCLDTTFILLITTITTIIISITKHILHNAVVIVTLLMIYWWTTRYVTYKLKKTKLILKANAVNCASVQYLTIRQRPRVVFFSRWLEMSGYRPQNTRTSCCWVEDCLRGQVEDCFSTHLHISNRQRRVQIFQKTY